MYKFTLKLDGQIIMQTNDDFEIIKYLHNTIPCSVHHATTFEGYTIEDISGNKIKY